MHHSWGFVPEGTPALRIRAACPGRMGRKLCGQLRGFAVMILVNKNSFSFLLLGGPVWSSQPSCTGVESKFGAARLLCSWPGFWELALGRGIWEGYPCC